MHLHVKRDGFALKGACILQRNISIGTIKDVLLRESSLALRSRTCIFTGGVKMGLNGEVYLIFLIKAITH